MAITVSKLYAPLFDDTVKEVVEPSGRCTAKSTSNEIAAIALMLKSRYNNIRCNDGRTDRATSRRDKSFSHRRKYLH